MCTDEIFYLSDCRFCSGVHAVNESQAQSQRNADMNCAIETNRIAADHAEAFTWKTHSCYHVANAWTSTQNYVPSINGRKALLMNESR